MTRNFQLSHFTPVGAKGVIVKALPYEERRTDTGLLIDKYDPTETDGGKLTFKHSTEKFSTIAEVLSVSKAAQKFMDDHDIDVKVGDFIVMSPAAKISQNWFNLTPQYASSDFEGYFQIHPNTIQSKIDYEQD